MSWARACDERVERLEPAGSPDDAACIVAAILDSIEVAGYIADLEMAGGLIRAWRRSCPTPRPGVADYTAHWSDEHLMWLAIDTVAYSARSVGGDVASELRRAEAALRTVWKRRQGDDTAYESDAPNRPPTGLTPAGQLNMQPNPTQPNTRKAGDSQ